MQSIQDDYNTQRSPLTIAEYGRTVQEYVTHIQSLPEKEERTQMGASIGKYNGNT